MGCSSSSNRNKMASNEFYQEAKGFESKKLGGQSIEEKDKGLYKAYTTRDGGITFYEEEAGHADESCVVKPWLENIISPDTELEENLDEPKYNLSIDYIFGYRIADCRQNLFYFGNEQLLFMSGSLGIIQNIDDSSQILFGGFQRKDDRECHDDDIMCLSFFDGEVSMVATGQRGLKPTILVWSPLDTSVVYSKFNLPKGSKEVASLDFSRDGHYLIAVGKDEENSVYLFDLRKNELVQKFPTNKKYTKTEIKEKGCIEYLIDVTGSENQDEICISGVNKIFFLKIENKILSKNYYSKVNKHYEEQNVIFTCSEYISGNQCIIGSDEGIIYIFNYSKERQYDTYYHITPGSVQNIVYYEKKNQIFVSDSKCNVFLLNKNFEISDSFEMPSVVRALDVNDDGEIAMGLRDGSIMIYNQKEKRNDIFVKSHCEGSIRGIDFIPQTRLVTTGDDNRILIWNLRSKKCEEESQINDFSKIADPKNPDKEITHPGCRSGCVAYNRQRGHIAVGTDFGTLSIRTSIKKLDVRLFDDIVIVPEMVGENKQSLDKLPLTELKYTPFGDWLIVSAQSGDLTLLDVNNNYEIIGNFCISGDYIKNFDWDTTTTYIQAETKKNKLIFFEIMEKSKVQPYRLKKDGVNSKLKYSILNLNQNEIKAKKVQNLDWLTFNCKFGYSVQGIYMGSTDPEFIKAVSKAHTKKIILSGDDDKLLNLYNNPCISDDPKTKSFKGHAGHIKRILFSDDDDKVITIAEEDKAIIVWNLTQE